jgi:hypothetical protein
MVTRGETCVSFIQIIEFRTSRFDEGAKFIEEYRAATEGKRTVRRVRVGKDLDEAGRYFTIAEFDSHEDAMRNSEMPETTKLAEQLQSLADGPARFYNLEVVHEEE